MGCNNAKRNAYSESTYSFESEIRDWEVKLGTFDKTLFDILSGINAKLIVDPNIPKLKIFHFFNLNLKEEKFEDILKLDILRFNSEKDGLYNPDMLKILFFLLTKSTISNNNKTDNQDKAKFLYSILMDDTEVLDKTIDRENPNLIAFLTTCVTISCVSLVGKKKNHFKMHILLVAGNKGNRLNY